jgi:hypothetical protein
MRLHAVYCNAYSPGKQPSPNSYVLKILKCQTDQVRLFVGISDIGVYSILAAAVALIRSDATYGPPMSNCWLPVATWVEALMRTGNADASIIIDVRKFNASMSKSSSFGSVMTRFDRSNPTGVFRIDFKHQFFYDFTDQERQMEYPRPLSGAWKERVLEVLAANVLAIPSTTTSARPALLDRVNNEFFREWRYQ